MKNSNQSRFSLLHAGIVLSLGSLILTFLAILGWFQVWQVWLFFLVFLFVLIQGFLRERKKMIVWVVLVFSLFSSFMFHELPLGRDDAGYMTAAVKISETGGLSFYDFFGRPFHPFRNINHDQSFLTSQFIPGYTTYLAGWHAMFGVSGIFWSNFFLVFFSLLALFKVGLSLDNRKSAWLSLVLLLSFYTSFWFFRRTVSENLIMLLFWLSAWCFVGGVRFKNYKTLFLGLVPASFMMLVRGEGMLYSLTYLFALVFVLYGSRTSSFRKINVRGYYQAFLALPFVTFLFYWIYTSKFGGSYIFQHIYDLQRTILRDFIGQPVVLLSLLLILIISVVGILVVRYKKPKLRVFSLLFGAIILLIPVAKVLLDYYYTLDPEATFTFALYRNYFILRIFSAYLILPFLLIIGLGLLFAKIKKSRVFIYLLFLALPSFLFLIDPFIALDQPWFMRRFYPILIPIMFLLVARAIAELSLKPPYNLVLIFVLVGANLAIASPIVFFKDHHGVGTQIDSMATKLDNLPGKKKLFIMNPGWSWQQWSYHLHFLKDIDVLPKLDGISQDELAAKMAEYDQVYVISRDRFDIILSPYVEQPRATLENPNPELALLFPDEKLNFVSSFRLEYPRLEKTCPMTAYIFSQGDAISPQRFELKCYLDIVATEVDYEIIDMYIYKLSNK